MRISDWSSDVCSSDLYGAGDVSRLRFIRRAQAIGFSLDEIAGLLNLGGESSCEQMQRLVERKLADVRLRLGELRQLECDLEHMRVHFSHVPAVVLCSTLDLLYLAGAGLASVDSSRSILGYSFHPYRTCLVCCKKC